MRRLLRLWRTSGSDLRTLILALRDPSRPRWLVAATVLLTIFALDPFNFAVPLMGVLDDFVLLPLLLRWLVRAAATSRSSVITTAARSTTFLPR